MKIKRVQFQNYRCFLNDEVKLPKEKDNKNINLFIAPNGGGKTEFLFSIWWALYPDSFNFSDLKGKEATNYSLNSDLYFQLTHGPIGAKQECFVEIEFENEGNTYIINRKETFEKKSSNNPVKNLSCSLYTINENGITTPPTHDSKEINNTLERIIPQKVLSGIIFDGERMKKISSIDEESVKSIEGVIADITNKEVLSAYESELNSMKNHYQKSIKVYANRLKSTSLEEITTDIEKYVKELNNNNLNLDLIEPKIPQLEKRIKEISEKLQALEPSSKIEKELIAAENDLKHYENSHRKNLGSFKSQMSKEGSYILTRKLAKDLENVINSSDVPLGLNVKIVNNILERDSCICGTPFSHSMRCNLNELNEKLPPNDINATIKEQTKTIQYNAKRSKENMKKLYKSMDENYRNSEDSKAQISFLKAQLTESVSEEVSKLEFERKQNELELEQLIKQNDLYKENIIKINKELSRLEELQSKLTSQEKEIDVLQKRKNFVEKVLKAVRKVQEEYRMIALSEINTLFSKAYSNISEDFSDGRRAYLTHRLSKKYLMVTYNENDLVNYLRDTKGHSEEMIISGEIDSSELEEAINTTKISNSTGQQTVMSLAFVKAMLDYSRKEFDERDRELKKVKSYPVVIDAPFSDLSGENLDNAASNINDFSEQILLLINEESFSSIKSNIINSISSVHYFHKSKVKQFSTIEEGESQFG